MQNPSVVRNRAVASSPARVLPWSFLLLVILCACVVTLGFFFAASQHFTSMDYGIKNSRLREQLQNLETEKRRLMLAREVALSPVAIRKAAHNLGMRKSAEVAAVQIAAKAEAKPQTMTAVQHVKAEAGKPATTTKAVMKTVMAAPVQTKSSGETRTRVVEAKDKKDRTEVAALLKLR